MGSFKSFLNSIQNGKDYKCNSKEDMEKSVKLIQDYLSEVDSGCILS